MNSKPLGHRTKAELAAQKAKNAPPDAPGLPPKPPGMDRHWRRCWDTWAQSILKRRLLSRADGAALSHLVDLDLAGDEEGKRKLVQETWGNREPFPEDVEPAPADAPTTPTLEGFLQDVAAVRAYFAQ